MKDNTVTDFTRNYLQFCYTCLDAHQCDTEGKCVACWDDKAQAAADEEQAITTEDLLRLYAL
ncbi:hypothetical protein D3C78_838520 [compost metagenome]